MIENAISFLLFLSSIAGALTVLIKQFKPVFLDKVLETSGEQVYIVTIYAIRTVGALVGLALMGGIGPLVELIPFLATVPPLGVWVLSILIIVLGTEVIHPLIETLYAWRDALGQPTIPPVTPPVVTENRLPDEDALG